MLSLVFVLLVGSVTGSDITAPVIHQGPLNITGIVGTSVTFDCEGEGNPTPNIVVIKEHAFNDFTVYNTGANSHTSKVMVSRTISNVAYSDKGWYVCAVSNEHGVVTSRAYLDIVEDPCRKVRCPRGKYCHADELTLRTECRCKPCEDFTYSPVCGSDCQDHYNPCQMKKKSCEAGSYITIANKGPCNVTDVELSVSSRAVELVEGDKLSLACSHTGHPAPTVTRWVKEKGKNGKASQRAVSKTGEYIVEEVAVKDKGTYKCVAQQCGVKVVSETVKVVVHPKKDIPVDEPVPEGKVCRVFGDPHILSFDGKAFDFMGRCSYVLAMDCVANTWMLYGQFMPCGDGASCLEQMTLYYGDMRPLTLTRGWIVARDGEKFRLRKKQPTTVDNLLLTYTGTAIEVVMDNGVRIVYDGFWGVEVIVAEGAVTCGICGNNNGDPEDDVTIGRFGPTGGDIDTFGMSWGLSGVGYDWCGVEVPSEDRTCNEDRAQVEQDCDNFLESEAFEACAALVGTTFYRDSCILDGCTAVVPRYEGEIHCAYASSLAQHCRTAGVPVAKDFLQELGCGTKRQFQRAVYEAGCPLAGNPPFLDPDN